METRNLIIICIASILIVGICAGAYIYINLTAAGPTVLIDNNNGNSIYKGDNYSVLLVDENGTGIPNKTVELNFTNSKNKTKTFNVTTNSKGKAKIDLNLSKGKYKVIGTFYGDDDYKSSNFTKKIKIKVKKAKKTSSSSATTSSTNTYQKYSPQYGTYVNEYTDSNGVQHIDGANGMRSSYDPSTGIETFDDGHGNVESYQMG